MDSTAVFALSHTPFAVLFKANGLNFNLEVPYISGNDTKNTAVW